MAQTVTNMTSVRKVCSSSHDWITERHDSFIQKLLTFKNRASCIYYGRTATLHMLHSIYF
jgi:hypothetical protein